MSRHTPIDMAQFVAIKAATGRLVRFIDGRAASTSKVIVALHNLARHDGSHYHGYCRGYTVSHTVYEPGSNERVAQALVRPAAYAEYFATQPRHQLDVDANEELQS